MFSKVFLFILISCPLTLCSSVYQNGQSLNGAINPTQEELKQSVESVLIKVAQAIDEVLETLVKQIEQGFNARDVKQSVDKLQEVLEQAFNTNENGESPSEHEIQKAVNNAVKHICEVFEGVFTASAKKVEENLNYEELKKSIGNLNVTLSKIFDYETVNKEEKSALTPVDEEIENITNGQVEKIAENLKRLFKRLFVEMLENSEEEINSTEAELVKHVLQEFFDYKSDSE